MKDHDDEIKKIIKAPKMPLLVRFGENLKQKRLPLSLSQLQLAELAGFHFSYISSVERGERNISLVNIDKLATALNCSLKDLMPS